jgi:hypothetical protein
MKTQWFYQPITVETILNKQLLCGGHGASMLSQQ